MDNTLYWLPFPVRPGPEATINLVWQLLNLNFARESTRMKELLRDCPWFFNVETEAHLIGFVEDSFIDSDLPRTDKIGLIVRLAAFLGIARHGRLAGVDTAVDAFLEDNLGFINVYVPEYAERVLSAAATPPWEDWEGFDTVQ